MKNTPVRSISPAFIYAGLGAILLVMSGGLLSGYFLVAAQAVVPSAAAAVTPARVDPSAVAGAVQEFLTEEVTVQIGEASLVKSWNELGVILDQEALDRAARLVDGAVDAQATAQQVRTALTDSGAMPVVVDRARAVAVINGLKESYDQAPRDAVMDLEKRLVHRDEGGLSLDVHRSVSTIEAAALLGGDTVALHTIAIPAEITVEDLGIDDISHVLATFTTKFSVTDRIRNFNLKMAAAKLDGYVLQPGVEFSFNDVVGPRTENEGYKIAGVINAGEMVDGLAGGTCQISTTLHGAAFFAGLGITKSLPHSRPSTYAHMGLDATVVYPYVDLKLRNDYDFPVVIHFRVTHGESVVEILGKERPYDEVAFERKVVERIEFDTVTREDDTMPVGSMKIDQRGFYGYLLERTRKYVKDGKIVKRDKWKLRYQPVTEYVRTGTNPDPNLPMPEPTKKKQLREPNDEIFRLTQ